jgi:enolase
MNQIKAKEILDSNQKPTVEVRLETDFGVFKASVPSGVSTGKYEAVELRDEYDNGVKKAISNVEKIIAPALEKEDLTNQKRIDEILIKLDGTKNKSRLGANAILAVSMAVCRAGAAVRKIQLYQYIFQLAGVRPPVALPKPAFNMIEGGKHASYLADSKLAFQEFMAVPQKESFKENLEAGEKIYQKLKGILGKKYGKENVKLSAEGAFSAPIQEISEALDLILRAAEKANEKDSIRLAIDAAASEFSLHRQQFMIPGEGGDYRIDGRLIFKKELLEFYKNLVEKYPIISLEDPFWEEDFDSFAELRKMIGPEAQQIGYGVKDRVIIFGDDLTASNIGRIRMAKERRACSGLILKPNQIGTVTETIDAAKLAKSYGWKIMVANRAGETEDDFIADLAVGIEADFIKSGAPFPKERMAKYNRILEIEKARS